MGVAVNLTGNDLSVESVTATGAVTGSSFVASGNGSVRVKQAVTQVNDSTPTKAELTTALGDPATVGRGFIGTVDDNDGNTNFYFVCASDADYFFVKLTKAT